MPSFNFADKITASGGTNGTRVNSAGVIVAATAPRFDYNPATLAALGLLVEESRTNLFLNALLNGTNLSTQGVTVSAQAYTISFYGTGSITLTGAYAATANGGGAYPNRTTLTFTPSAGTLTCTVSGTVQYAQIEAGNFATSFIPTAGSSVTRTADVISMTGANFSDWFNQSAGTFVVAWDTHGTDLYCMVISCTGGNPALINVGTFSWYNGSTYITGLATNSPGGVVHKDAFAFASGSFAAATDGAAGGTGSDVGLPTPTDIFIGSQGGTIRWLNGHIRRVDFYNTRLPDAALQSLTA